MTSGASRPLTERQAAVMERVDRRVPIKVIARELGVSETRINQHIRALKGIYGVSNLGDLVEEYRADQEDVAGEENGDLPELENSEQKEHLTTSDKGLGEDAYRNSQVPAHVFGMVNGERDTAGTVELSDVLPMIDRAPWLKPGEPKVVPGLLDGEQAVMFRLAAIIAIAFGLLAAVVLTVTAAITISEALDGRAAVPVDDQGFPVERG